MPASIDEVVARAVEDEVRLVRFLYCDPSGVIRGKAVHVDRLASRMHSGVGLTRGQNAVNMLDAFVPIEGMEPVGEIRIVPDPDTYRAPALAAAHRQPALRPARPRLRGLGLLHAQLPEARHRRGPGRWASRSRPPSRTSSTWRTSWTDASSPSRTDPCYSSAGMDRVADVMDDILAALEAQGLEIEQAINEYGPGQQEIAIRYDTALEAADDQLRFRDTVRGVAEVAPRAHLLVRGQALRARRRLRGAHPLQPLVARRAAQPHVRRRGRRPAPLRAGPPVRGRRAGAPARPRGADLSELQLVRAAAAQRLGRRHGLVGAGQPRVRRPRGLALPRSGDGVDERGAQGLRPELQPVPGARRPHPGGPRRHRDAAWSRRSRHASTRRACPRSERQRSGIRPLPGSLREALGELQADEVLFPALGDLLGRCLVGVRTAEIEALEQMTPEQARLAHLRVF